MSTPSTYRRWKVSSKRAILGYVSAPDRDEALTKARHTYGTIFGGACIRVSLESI